MATYYANLCPVCDEEVAGLTFECSNCLNAMCRVCYNEHQVVCTDRPARQEARGGGGYGWGRRSGRRFASDEPSGLQAPRFRVGQGDNPDDLATRLNQLSAFVDDMVTKYNAVEIKASALQDENRSLRQDLRSAHDNNTQLLLDLQKLQRDVENMHREMQDVRDKNFALTEDVATLKKETAKMTKHVAFHARLPANIYPQSTGYVIICSDVLTSIGGGYDPQTGVFTVPVAGTYLFMASASSDAAGNVFYIDLDGNNIASPYQDSSAYGSTTCHVTVKLSEGQKVCMKEWNGCNYLIQGSSGQFWTSFSGMLLQAEM